MDGDCVVAQEKKCTPILQSVCKKIQKGENSLSIFDVSFQQKLPVVLAQYINPFGSQRLLKTLRFIMTF